MAARKESSSSPLLVRTGLLLILVILARAGAHGAEPSPKLSVSAAKALAAERAPEVDPRTLLAFAQNESGLIPTAIHDDTTGNTFFPPSTTAAFALATTLLKQGHSLDLGLMQVNTANLART